MGTTKDKPSHIPAIDLTVIHDFSPRIRRFRASKTATPTQWRFFRLHRNKSEPKPRVPGPSCMKRGTPTWHGLPARLPARATGEFRTHWRAARGVNIACFSAISIMA